MVAAFKSEREYPAGFIGIRTYLRCGTAAVGSCTNHAGFPPVPMSDIHEATLALVQAKSEEL